MAQRQDDSAYIVVLTTLATDEQARAFVRRLVDERVVACGTVLGSVTSVYRWKGTVEEAGETQVLLKTRRDRWADLEAAARQWHPYEVPELLALPVERGLPSYLEWLADQTTAGGAS